MTTPSLEPTGQLGLLDLSVDLSVPEVYSGTDFTVYLHIKNPFAVAAWIDAVELSLPTQVLKEVGRPKETSEARRRRPPGEGTAGRDRRPVEANQRTAGSSARYG
ncbi:hypothetical protein [Streptacidiphilus jiangxiensis]|uniref:hypothetical protein n=1 Tax=Streptacidiphilus jiangxiensis TaxID=235985 RepID=UPI001160D987|nr:hypothetical protein [Streptacidiphilus jiangxiensis]